MIGVKPEALVEAEVVLIVRQERRRLAKDHANGEVSRRYALDQLRFLSNSFQ